MRVGNDFVEAVDVFLGGQVGESPKLATKVLDTVPLSQVAERLTILLGQTEDPQIRAALAVRA
jgi:hypothetical protein